LSRRVVASVAGLLAILTFIAYAPVLDAGFTNYDDDVYVTANYHVQHGLDGTSLRWAFTTTRAANWHPLTWISHTLDWSAFGDRPRGHHATSLLLHVANVAILFLLLGAMTRAWWPSALAAALFAVHPLHVESVAWIAERKDVLATFFGLLAIAGYARYAKAPSMSRMTVVVLLCAIGLLAKPMLVTLPFVLLLLDTWPLERRTSWRLRIIEKLPLFALASASAFVTVWAQRQGGAVASLDRFPIELRLGNAAWSVVAYIEKTIWPRGLAVFYPHPGATVIPWGAALGLLVICGVTGLAWWQRRRRPYVLVGWLWFLGTLVPVMGLVQVGKQGMADRYMDLPSIGLFVVVAWASAEFGKRAVVPAVAAVIALAVVTHAQATVWHDSITLFTHAIPAIAPRKIESPVCSRTKASSTRPSCTTCVCSNVSPRIPKHSAISASSGPSRAVSTMRSRAFARRSPAVRKTRRTSTRIWGTRCSCRGGLRTPLLSTANRFDWSPAIESPRRI
jgi:hypothetical protein